MKNTSNWISSSFCTRIGWIILFFFFPFMVTAQSYEQLWKGVEQAQQKDLPRSVMQQLMRICEKAEREQHVAQLMKAHLSRAVQQVKLTPDSAEVEVSRLQTWAATEKDPIASALLYHVIGNMEMQRKEVDWKHAMDAYRRALVDKERLLKTPAHHYAPVTVSTDFSQCYFQDNLYDLLVHQTVAGLLSNWQWGRKVEVQEWILDLYDSLIDAYGPNQLDLPTAALLAHEAKIVFLSEKSVASPYRLSAEAAEKSWKDLLLLYEQPPTRVAVDVLVDVHLKLAESLCDQQKLEEAMTVLQTAKKKYSESSLLNEVQGKMEWIQHPSLTVQIPMVYPARQADLVVNYKNLKEFKLETYRLRLKPDAPELNGNLSMDVLCRTYGKKIDVQRFRLPQTTDYKPRIETLSYQLPQEGIYVLKATPLDREGKADSQLMYVSPYQCIMIPLLDGRTEVTVVDRFTGNPVPHAEVVAFQRVAYSSNFTSPKVWKTDEQGSVIVQNPKQGALHLNARTAGCDFMKILSYYPGRNHQVDETFKARRLTALFADRALYRPGQVVHVSGIRYEQRGDSLRTLQGEPMKVELLDVNGKKVSEASATTDSFGVFALDFTLPKQVLPGRFTVRTDNKTLSLRVENYKRPTFDVVLNPIDKTYTFNDVVQVKGTAHSFAGAPIRLAKGSYSVVRSEAWMWRNGANEEELCTGSFSTDAEGHFTLNVRLEPPVNGTDLDRVPYYNYQVRAVVTDGAGETQESVLAIPVGKRSMGIRILGLEPKLACERKAKIQFQAMNLNKQLVKKEVTYQVCQSKKIVFEGKAMTQEAFIPLEIYALPKGKYQLKVSARDDQGRLVTSSQEFILFSLADKRLPIQTEHWFYQDGSDWEDGNNVGIYVGTSEQQLYLMVDVFTAKKRIRSERLLLNDEIRQFDFAYEESYGDGIVVTFTFLRKGVLYTRQVKLNKPKPQKELMLKWETFRDQLTPGQQEVWRMKITDHMGNHVKANLLGALYDSSLDRLESHQWYLRPSFRRWLPYIGIRSSSYDNQIRGQVQFPYRQNRNGFALLGHDTYSRLLAFPIWNQPYYYYATTETYAAPLVAMKAAGMPARSAMAAPVNEMAEDEFVADAIDVDETEAPAYVRENFAETAFYYPTLRTDENGVVTLTFTLPDALTEWKFMGLAHTQQMDYGLLTSKVNSSKPFMVQSNLPRFVRVGDTSTLSVSLVNLSMEKVEGKVRMELVDPLTGRLVLRKVRDFNVNEGETGVAQFTYKVLDDYEVLACRIIAEAGNFSDGEQHYLPILPQKEWITETIPFQVRGDESVDISLKRLFNHGSDTATGKLLTIELTANPNWYLIQALSVMANPTSDDAISWATAYYSNAMALQLIRNYPGIQQVFELWLAEGATKETFWSKLEMNAQLKSLLLEETPWLAEAQTEAEQKRRVALLFELNGMEQRLQLATQQLKKLQNAEGGWSWYPGMSVNRYTSTQVVELMARLKWNGIRLNAGMDEVYRKGLNYLQQEAKREYEYLAKQHANSRPRPSEQVVRYLYICALDIHAQQQADQKVNTFFLNELSHVGIDGIYQKAMMAIVMHANGKTREAASILQSLKEYLVYSPAMGKYFDTYQAAYTWHSYRIPSHVAAMEAIYQISPDVELLDEMKLWLLKQKQVQTWNTPLATVDAIHAFLLGEQSVIARNTKLNPRSSKTMVHPKTLDALQTSGKMEARWGKQKLVTPDDALGYVSTTLNEANLSFLKGKAKLHVEKEGKGIGWGAVYAQCFEEMDRVEESQTNGLSVEREYWLNGERITPQTMLHVGDQLTVRFSIKADRDMDFICIRDQRAACMEPADQLSGYVWMKGLSAYRVNRDVSTIYFIDKLPKGKHQLEYRIYLNRTGVYQCGTASIQSVYAPEFTSHTGGFIMDVKR